MRIGGRMARFTAGDSQVNRVFGEHGLPNAPVRNGPLLVFPMSRSDDPVPPGSACDTAPVRMDEKCRSMRV